MLLLLLSKGGGVAVGVRGVVRGGHMMFLVVVVVAQQHHAFLGKCELVMHMIECADIKIRSSCSKSATFNSIP